MNWLEIVSKVILVVFMFHLVYRNFKLEQEKQQWMRNNGLEPSIGYRVKMGGRWWLLARRAYRNSIDPGMPYTLTLEFHNEDYYLNQRDSND